MNNKKNILWIPLFIMFTVSGYNQTVKAEESDIEINIVQSPISLTHISELNFGTHEVSNEKQEYQPINDLEIVIEDIREISEYPWEIRYEYSLFQKNNESLDVGSLSIGAGNLTKNNNIKVENQITPEIVTLGAKQIKTLVKTKNSEKGTYTYIVPKELIKISLKDDLPSGNYQAVQTVTLFTVLPIN